VAAQEPTFTLSPYTPPAPASVLVSGASTDSHALPPDAASLPLRLSLLSSVYPLGPAFSTGGCSGPSVAAAGTIFPTQLYTQLHLTPRLVLHGFSDLGCPGDPFAPLDAGMGGGLTYAMPLRPSLWLVGSGGAYAVPGQLGLPVRVAGNGGLDLAVEEPKTRRTLTAGFGVSTTAARGGGVRLMPRVGGTF
jgi:hypothetical protein